MQDHFGQDETQVSRVPRLSIVMPAYNVAPYIAACLDSILGQMRPDCELVVYDDFSQDETRTILARYGDRIKLALARENGGISCARNEVLARATGEYIWFVDSDDIVKEGAIAAIFEVLDRFAPDVVAMNFTRWKMSLPLDHADHLVEDRSMEIASGHHRAQGDDFLIASMASNNLQLWSRVFHRKLFAGGLRFTNGAIFEDVELVPLLMARARSLYYLPMPVITYRQRPNSFVTGLSLSNEKEALTALERMTRRFEAEHGAMVAKTRGEVMRFAALNLTRGLKKIHRADVPSDQKKALLAELLERFRRSQNIGLGKCLLLSLAQGQVSTALRLMKWLMRSGGWAVNRPE